VRTQIKWEDLAPTLVKKLGSGSFGQVYEAYLHSAPMAVKIINLEAEDLNLKQALIRFKCASSFHDSFLL
jgi:serine/threonine protein kinase